MNSRIDRRSIEKSFIVHIDRGIIESCPGLYFVGLPFLYSLSSALLGGVGRDARHIVDSIRSTRLSGREHAAGRFATSC